MFTNSGSGRQRKMLERTANGIDEQIFAESILSRVYNQIAKADLIIADMTGRNPNVFYEVGYAHALGQTVILLTRRADDVPFDLKHYPHIIYGTSISRLKTELGKRVAYHLANPDSKRHSPAHRLDFVIAGTSIKPGVLIDVPIRGASGTEVATPVGVNNVEETVFAGGLRLGVVLPEELPPQWGYRWIQLPDKTNLHDLGPIGELLLSGWETASIHFIYLGNPPKGVPFPATLKKFMPTGPESVDFLLRFVSKA